MTHTTATILEQSNIVALECAALYMEPIGGATHSSATILPFLPYLVLFWINNQKQMLKNINSISVWQFWLNKLFANVFLRHSNLWLKIKSFNLDLLSSCLGNVVAFVRVTNEWGVKGPPILCSKIGLPWDICQNLWSKIWGALNPPFSDCQIITKVHMSIPTGLFLAYNFILIHPFWLNSEHEVCQSCSILLFDSYVCSYF